MSRDVDETGAAGEAPAERVILSPGVEVPDPDAGETRLRETSPVILRDLLGRHTIDGFARLVLEEERDGDGDDEADDEEEVFLIRIDGVCYAFWSSTSTVFPMIYCAQEGGPTWHLVPAATDCAAYCADTHFAIPVQICDLVSAALGVDPPIDQEGGRVTRVVDAETGAVFLELGVEWYEYQSRCVLPLALAGASGRVLPGESVVVVGCPANETYNVRRLLIAGEAEHWVIEDVRVGERSQLEAGHGDLPGTFFSPVATVGLIIESIDPGRPLSVRARYTGSDPEGLELCCVAMLESSSEVTRWARRVVVGGSWYYAA
jgi:hypothetical protein